MTDKINDKANDTIRDGEPILPAATVLAAGLGSSIAGTLLLTKMADGMLSHQTRGFDKRILRVARDARHQKTPLMDQLMSVLSAAGEPWCLYPVTGLVAARWSMEERQADSATLVLALLGSAGINQVLKRLVRRPRPIFKLPLARAGSSGSSFPSNHATMSLATYGTIAYLVARRRAAQTPKGRRSRRSALRIWTPVLLLCGLIGWSRVYQGVHNPSDVIGGWVAGSLWLATCSMAGTFASS